MILTPQEMLELYEAVVKPFGHPDPLGYMTRALLTSEGDPDYVDLQGKQGFQPVLAADAAELVGAPEIQSLQANVTATLAMDRLFFEKFADLTDMIVAFHYGEDQVGEDLTSEQTAFLNDINESRDDMLDIMYPPFATVDDVIKQLTAAADTGSLTAPQKKFFGQLLEAS